MLIIGSVALIALITTNILQTKKIKQIKRELEASDSVVLEAERIIRRNDLENEALYNPVLRSVLTKFYKQTGKGLDKYGHSVKPEGLTDKQWLLHLQEELIDSTVYIETLIQKRSDGR